ncbi:MAG: glycosyltransferase [Polyangiaceae bacterium]
MTEALGRSQVLPYVFGLAKSGVEMEVLSFEPQGTSDLELQKTRELLRDQGVRWFPQVRSPRHDLATKVRESFGASLAGLARALRRFPRVVHARSYIPAAVADLIATITPGSKLLFDCRGMLGDEYVDAGHWSRDQVSYKALKRVEKRLFRRAEGLVVLTHALRDWLMQNVEVRRDVELSVIPCCVDLEKFGGSVEARNLARKKLGIGDDELLVTYSGSLGTWYMEREMAAFFAHVRRGYPAAKFLLLSRSPTDGFVKALAEEGIPASDVIVRGVSPDDMPALLPAGDLGVSFIKPCFSKVGSSPTKVAEYLSSGMPVVVNANIGDQRDLAPETSGVVVTEDFSKESLAAVAIPALALARRPFVERAAAARDVARKHFGLAELGVPKYQALYRALDSKRVS